MTTKGSNKSLFKYPSGPHKTTGPYRGVGLPNTYGTKQQPPKKTSLHLSKGVPPLTLN